MAKHTLCGVLRVPCSTVTPSTATRELCLASSTCYSQKFNRYVYIHTRNHGLGYDSFIFRNYMLYQDGLHQLIIMLLKNWIFFFPITQKQVSSEENKINYQCRCSFLEVGFILLLDANWLHFLMYVYVSFITLLFCFPSVDIQWTDQRFAGSHSEESSGRDQLFFHESVYIPVT